MRDRKNHTTSSSSQQAAANQSGKQRNKASGTDPANAARSTASVDDVSLSRNWGGPGATVTIAMVRRARGALGDLRVLWGLAHGTDGYTLLPVVHADGDDRSITFTVPARSLPGAHVVQLEHADEPPRRLRFVVTAQEPPAASPFRILRTEPTSGTLRLYQTLCLHRSNPEKAVEELTKLLKGYDTFFDPMPTDPKFQEILDEDLTPYEKRQKFAAWLVTNQLAAEGVA